MAGVCEAPVAGVAGERNAAAAGSTGLRTAWLATDWQTQDDLYVLKVPGAAFDEEPGVQVEIAPRRRLPEMDGNLIWCPRCG